MEGEDDKIGTVQGDSATTAYILSGDWWLPHLKVHFEGEGFIRIPMEKVVEMVKQFDFIWKKKIVHRYVQDVIKKNT